MPLNENHVPMVLFSGGLDSTFMLHQALLKFKTVDLVTVSLTGQSEKTERESTAMSAITRELASMYHETFGYEHTDRIMLGRLGRRFAFPVPGEKLPNCSTGMMQPIGWMYAIAGSLYRGSLTEQIWIGYVNGDAIMPGLESLSHAWDHLAHACVITGKDECRPVLHFPLRHTTKEHILLNTPDRLLKHVSWCESGNPGNDCGECDPCRRMLKECLALEYFHPERWQTHVLRARIDAIRARRESEPSDQLSKVTQKIDTMNQASEKPKYYQPIGIDTDSPLLKELRSDIQLHRDPAHGYFLLKTENFEKGHLVSVTLHTSSGELKMTIREPSSGKTKDFFTFSPFDLDDYDSGAATQKRGLRLIQHLFTLSDGQCHAFLYPEEAKEKRKKKAKT